jgi:hypothetical protein
MRNPTNFDVRKHLEDKRQCEYRYCSDLLWENLDTGTWNQLGLISGHTLTDQEKIETQINHFFPILAQFFIVFSHSVEMIEDKGAKEILKYGGSRRIGSIRLAVEKVIDIAPPSRVKPLQRTQQNEVTDALLVLYVHMVGVFDAFAIALDSKLGLKLDKRKIDLMGAKFLGTLALPQLTALMAKYDLWLHRIKDELRNRFVHRVPPYIPDSRFTQEEADRYADLEREKFRLLIEDGDIEGSDNISEEQKSLGTFWPVIAFTDNNTLYHLHPTLLDDTFRFCCLNYELLEILLPILAPT